MEIERVIREADRIPEDDLTFLYGGVGESVDVNVNNASKCRCAGSGVNVNNHNECACGPAAQGSIKQIANP